ncbi:hypothetical protein [Vibrio sp. Hal054]|uniref:hypothetical protein n=1 Tax=Vibrio sp. Hal054 TaxID=3035158 RepID=UPI00301D11EC
MFNTTNLSVLGLTLDIIGVILLWIFVAEISFADKKEFLKGNATLHITDPTHKEVQSYKWRVRITRLAMALVVIGFLCQLASIYYKP